MISSFLPISAAWPSVADYITTELYPPKPDNNPLTRAVALVSDLGFVCNTIYLSKAFGPRTFAYEFTVPPAFHGLDVPYTYFNGPNPSVVDDPLAVTLQKYISRFAETGDPNGPGKPHFPEVGDSSTVLDLNATEIRPLTVDEETIHRCSWWQKALYS